MAQIGFKVNPARCVGCRACAVACKQELNTPKGISYRKVVEKSDGSYPTPKRLWVTMSCFHCEHPACLRACPVSPDKSNYANANNCIRKLDNFGIVLIDQDKCIGCKFCIAACPYGAPRYNANTKKVEKCTLCVHRVLNADRTATTGLKPACATTCPGVALDIEEPVQKTGTVPGNFSDRTLTIPSVTFDWGWLTPW